jgi:hypothetical protein
MWPIKLFVEARRRARPERHRSVPMNATVNHRRWLQVGEAGKDRSQSAASILPAMTLTPNSLGAITNRLHRFPAPAVPVVGGLPGVSGYGACLYSTEKEASIATGRCRPAARCPQCSAPASVRQWSGVDAPGLLVATVT